jgi:hypothetical protein
MIPRLALTLALVVWASAAADAQESEDFMRPCLRGDLLGHWQVIRSGSASGRRLDRGDPVHQPHQRYVFKSNATMDYRASATALTEAEERAFARAPAPTTWALERDGRLVRRHAGTAREETSDCRVVTRRLSDPRSPIFALPGDVVLTDQDEEARPIARRLLRKLPSEE